MALGSNSKVSESPLDCIGCCVSPLDCTGCCVSSVHAGGLAAAYIKDCIDMVTAAEVDPAVSFQLMNVADSFSHLTALLL